MSIAVLILVFITGNGNGGVYATQTDMPSMHACDREARNALAETKKLSAAVCINRTPERAN